MGYIHWSAHAFHVQTSSCWRPCLEREVDKVELSLYMNLAVFLSKDAYKCHAKVCKALFYSVL
jgi:hypothetical protein